jgi:hypothetical protein
MGLKKALYWWLHRSLSMSKKHKHFSLSFCMLFHYLRSLLSGNNRLDSVVALNNHSFKMACGYWKASWKLGFWPFWKLVWANYLWILNTSKLWDKITSTLLNFHYFASSVVWYKFCCTSSLRLLGGMCS